MVPLFSSTFDSALVLKPISTVARVKIVLRRVAASMTFSHRRSRTLQFGGAGQEAPASRELGGTERRGAAIGQTLEG